MVIVGQDGKEHNAYEGDLQITNSNERIVFVGYDGVRRTLGRYKQFERRISVFAEVYATKNSGQSRFVMPAR